MVRWFKLLGVVVLSFLSAYFAAWLVVERYGAEVEWAVARLEAVCR